MHRDVVGVARTTAVGVAARLAKSAKVDLLPVLDGNRLCGIATGLDLESAGGGDVGSVMKSPVFVQEDESIDRASDIMLRLAVGRIPVVDSKESMTCVGIITSSDIVKALKDEKK